MKKIPTLFEREFKNHELVGITDKVHPGMEWVLEGKGEATLKWDGSCCAIINGQFYKRYDAKRGKKPPAGAIPCCDPDPVTGHHPHWVLVDSADPANKHFVSAFVNTTPAWFDKTFEACGPGFQGNPYKLAENKLIPHGIHVVSVPRSFEGIREWLREHNVEGIVFWKDKEPQCKIRRKDFGFEWPVKEERP